MFESHITVSHIDDEHFKRACSKLGVKPVIIENDTGSHQRQLMTAKFHHTTDQLAALAEMYELADQLALVSYVKRRKLELILGKRYEFPLPKHLYLEFHLKYEVDPECLEEFREAVKALGGHTATNVAKDSKYQFASTRTQLGYFKLLKGLSAYKRVSVIRECVVFDDNQTLDSGWCGCECGIKVVNETD